MSFWRPPAARLYANDDRQWLADGSKHPLGGLNSGAGSIWLVNVGQHCVGSYTHHWAHNADCQNSGGTGEFGE